jgi:hypothetical protein
MIAHQRKYASMEKLSGRSFFFTTYFSHSQTERKPTASHNGDLCELRGGGQDDEHEKKGCHKVGVLLLLLHFHKVKWVSFCCPRSICLSTSSGICWNLRIMSVRKVARASSCRPSTPQDDIQ